MTLKASILIPAYNEEATILEILRQVNEQKIPGVELEIIVVDDGSKDRTVELLKANPTLYSKLVVQPKNGGKGAAVKAGLLVASGEYVLFQDADLEYDPKEYSKLFYPVLQFNADVVMGSRFLAPQYTRVHYYFNKMGNRFITFVFNILFNKTFTDIYTCYLMFRRELLVAQDLQSFGWEQQAEILCKVVSKGKALYEVPISYHGRTYEEGKKIRPTDVIPVLLMIVKQWFKK